MSDKFEQASDESSIALRILTAELAKEQSTSAESTSPQRAGENSSEDGPSTDSEPTHRGGTQIEGITTNTRESPLNENISSKPEERQTLFFFQIDNRTQATPFTPEDPEQTGRGFPIKGSGQIDSIIIVAQQNTFNVTLEVDNDKIVDNESWSELDILSADLAHIGAYQRASGEYVMSLSDYTFNQVLDFSIRPTSQTTFDTIRVEVMLDEYTTGVEQ